MRRITADERRHEAQPRAVCCDTPPRTRPAGLRPRRGNEWSTTKASANASIIDDGRSPPDARAPCQNSSRVPRRVTSVAGRTRAVLLDALGTLVHFEPPAPLLRAALRERLGSRSRRRRRRRRSGTRSPTTARTCTRAATPPRWPTYGGAARRPCARRWEPTARLTELLLAAAALPDLVPGRRTQRPDAPHGPGDLGGLQLGPLAARAPDGDRPGAARRCRGSVRRDRARQARACDLRARARPWPGEPRARRCTRGLAQEDVGGAPGGRPGRRAGGPRSAAGGIARGL